MNSLLTAAQEGNVAEVRRLAASNVLARRAALLEASRRGHVAVVAALLDVGDEFANRAVLAAAAGAGHTAVVALLLDAGVAATGGALCDACTYKHAAVVALLVAAGAPTYDAGLALRQASANGECGAVARLLAGEDDLTPSYNPALHEACVAGHDDVVALLLRACAALDVRKRAEMEAAQTAEERTRAERSIAEDVRALKLALSVASMHGHVGVVAQLLAHGASALPPSRALAEAAAHGHAEVCALLLAAGADVHEGRDCPLVLAAWRGRVAAVDLLLAAGADIRVDEDEPLATAGRNGHATVVEHLLAAGADAHGRAGCSAVYEASLRGDAVTVELLLRAGVDVVLVAWAQLSPDTWPGLLQCVPRGAFATLPGTGLQAAWLRHHLRPQLRLHRRLQAARDRLDRPPNETVEDARVDPDGAVRTP